MVNLYLNWTSCQFPWGVKTTYPHVWAGGSTIGLGCLPSVGASHSSQYHDLFGDMEYYPHSFIACGGVPALRELPYGFIVGTEHYEPNAANVD